MKTIWLRYQLIYTKGMYFMSKRAYETAIQHHVQLPHDSYLLSRYYDFYYKSL